MALAEHYRALLEGRSVLISFVTEAEVRYGAKRARRGEPMTDPWAVPAFLPYVHPPLTHEAVEGIERARGITLPVAYLQLLETQNGGYVRTTWPGRPHQRIDGIGSSFPTISSPTWFQDEGAEDEMWVPEQPELLVSFDGDGHWDLCLDYRASGPLGEPSVSYIDTEMEEDSPVAQSFDEFLAGLVDEVEHKALRIYADIGLEEFAAEFGRVCGCPIEDRGDFDHGYKTMRVDMGDGPLWAWISENSVPAGFRRDGNVVVTTPEAGLRLPTDKNCRLLIEYTDEAEAIVRDTCRSTGHWEG